MPNKLTTGSGPMAKKSTKGATIKLTRIELSAVFEMLPTGIKKPVHRFRTLADWREQVTLEATHDLRFRFAQLLIKGSDQYSITVNRREMLLLIIHLSASSSIRLCQLRDNLLPLCN